MQYQLTVDFDADSLEYAQLLASVVTVSMRKNGADGVEASLVDRCPMLVACEVAE